MERKPQPSFDRFSEKPARGRFSSGDRFADRGERRPRFGVMRAREFVMKDAYSFDKSA